MSTRRLRPEDWAPVHPTKITIRNSREPRDERPRIPGPAQRARPAPINIAPGHTIPLLTAPQSNRKPSADLAESLRDPEVVDLAAPNVYPRRASQFQFASRRMPSPSVSSQYSTRQSEVSFGILDYYMDREQPLTPNLMPTYPRLDTPNIDPAIEKFDFGLVPSPPKSPMAFQNHRLMFDQSASDANSGAERLDACLPASPPPTPPSNSQIEKQGPYSLFPRVTNTTPTSRHGSGSLDFPSSQGSTPTNNIMFVPYVHPDPSYRPRKESMSSSVRSRKDSFTSFSGTRRIPMRILSSSESAVTPKTLSTGSNSTSTTSAVQQSRWSDDTITSPTVATTPGLRMSFGSLFGREGAQYPDCFFEDDDDDDEAVPLRRRLLWKRSINLTPEQRAMKAGRFDERTSFGRRVGRALLCGGCCGRS